MAVEMRRPDGFTLLEAIVAMVIMATSLLALYSWLSANTLALNRVQAQTRSLEDARAALAALADVNPVVNPNGERKVGPLVVRWTSSTVAERRPGLSEAGMSTQFDHELFLVSAEVSRDGRLIREFSFRKAGWAVARPVLMDDGF